LWKSSSRIDEGVEALMEEGEEVAPDIALEEAKAALRGDEAPGAEAEAGAAETDRPIPQETDRRSQTGEGPEDGGPARSAPADAPLETGAETAAAGDLAPSSPKNSVPEPAPTSSPASSAGPSFAARMLAAVGLGDAPGGEKRRPLNDEMLEDIEDLLITADIGAATAARITRKIASGRFGRRIGAQELKGLLADQITAILRPVAVPLPITGAASPTGPQVILVVGVNGSGKTTTIGKIASQLKAGGKSVMIAAGDTFRAAAVEQLSVWGERAGVPVFKLPQGSDPASLAFDAMARAEREGVDVLLVDTAGRLQNRADLMEELAKIVRVIRKKDPSAPHNTLLVLDATTGQNALSQVKIFREVADVSGLIMTKLDGTARGGVLVALADQVGLPIHAIGVGEAIEDLSPFEPEDFAAALTGLER
ncbi:MAG: signal recognition particle-docking protein FtsY, partial [Pseudomonadota bacterium]